MGTHKYHSDKQEKLQLTIIVFMPLRLMLLRLNYFKFNRSKIVMNSPTFRKSQ
jgi:hypothetical protein